MCHLYIRTQQIPICRTDQGRTSIRGNPRICVLRYCVPNKGLHPLRRESGYPLKAKGITFAVTPFTCLTVL